MKKIYIALLTLIHSTFLFAGGVSPKFFNIPIYSPGNIAFYGDTIWMEAINGETRQIEKRLFSSQELLEVHTPDDYTSAANKIEIDPKGNVWVCTNNKGLLKYDGQSWIAYNDVLPDSEVTDVLFEGDTVWAATYYGIAKLVDNVWEEIETPVYSLTCIIKDTNGNLCFGSDSYSSKGVYKLENGNWNAYGEDLGLGDDRVNTLILNSNGNLLAGTVNHGFSELMADTIIYHHINSSSYGGQVLYLTIDSEDKIWAADNNGNIVVFGQNDTTYFSKNDLLGADICGLYDINGQMHIATENGTIIYENGIFSYYILGYPNLQIDAVAVDSEDNVWIAIDNDHIIYVKNSDGSWSIEDPQNGMSHSFIMGIEFSEDGTVWVATYGNGVFKKSQNQWEQFYSDNTPVIQHNSVVDIDLDSDGNPWIATENGAYHYNGIEWSALTLNDGLKSNDITDIAVDLNNNVWIAYYSGSYGLSMYNGSEVTTYTIIDNLPSNAVKNIDVAPDGKIWIATTAGLANFDGSVFSTFNFDKYWEGSTSVNGLYVDNDNNVYASKANDYYLTIMENDTIRFFDLYKDYYASIFDMNEDSKGDLWIATYSSGIIYMRKPPVADFFKTDTACLSDNFLFQNNSASDVIAYSWDIDNDGEIESTDTVFSFKFDKSGTHKIKLTVANDLDTNFIIKEVVVLPSPEVTIQSSSSSNVICADAQIALSAGTHNEYIWNTGDNKQVIIVDEQNIYSVTVTNTYGCSSSAEFDLKVNLVPEVSITSNSDNGYICPESEVVLSVDTDCKNILWSTNDTLKTITVTGSGKYQVTVTDSLGCENNEEIVINDKLPYNEQIGVVTASENKDYLLVAWEQTKDVNTASYNIYRFIGNSFDSIGNIQFGDTAVFIDPTANYKTTAYTYKLTTVDNCGNQSSLDDCVEHTSMHLIHIPNGNSYQLLWTAYQGNDVESYIIYQTNANGEFEAIDSVSGKYNTSYTILNYIKGRSYRVGVKFGYEVNPLLKSESGPYSQSLSNIVEASISVSSIEVISTFDANLSSTIVTDNLDINLDGNIGDEFNISIYTASGKKVISNLYNGYSDKNVIVNVEALSLGYYRFVITDGKSIVVKEFMKK